MRGACTRDLQLLERLHRNRVTPSTATSCPVHASGKRKIKTLRHQCTHRTSWSTLWECPQGRDTDGTTSGANMSSVHGAIFAHGKIVRKVPPFGEKVDTFQKKVAGQWVCG
eukprot:TRINITY_DN6216_c1_g1_i1.p1 TRINITY_DN6216_c1_g1~~TRINITY_DN6216_c1_g1_i1.p1  ORF type:complete len:111 (+),score=1.49 TRINITY_DN6216_c1_g1_i1:781-1113(+)